ncbi:MAG: PaaI family thioesterase [Paracoccaceae bacterium]|nr:PaaI family thioesterase [Paracoccaceae bacterium]
MPEPLIAQSIDDIVPVEKAAKISGLDYMLAILHGEFPAPPISQTMNYSLIDVTSGRVVFRGSPNFSTLNPMGTVHGGWYATLLDSAMACAISTKVDVGFISSTIEFKINIIRPVPLGMEVDVIGETDHAGRSTGVASGRIVGVDDQKLYATGSTTCIVMKVP